MKLILEIILLLLSSLGLFSQGFPLSEISMNNGDRFDYIMKYNIITSIESDTINHIVPINYTLNLPYKVNLIDDEYQLKLIKDGFNIQLQQDNYEDVTINTKTLEEENKSFDSEMFLDKKGKILEYNTYSNDSEISNILKIINTYSIGIFLEFPHNNKKTWEVSKPITIENNGNEITYSSTFSFDYEGNYDTKEGSFYKVNYNVSNFKMDVGNEYQELLYKLMETAFDINGYYLIDKNTGMTYQNFSRGSMRTIMDIAEFKSILDGSQYKSADLLIFQINFEGNSYLRKRK